MTQAQVVPYSLLIGDGAEDTFPYPWRIGDASELSVTINNVATTAFSVTGVGVATGGTVVFATAPASGAVVYLRRDTSRTQLTDYQDNDPFLSEAHEAALDKLTRITQEDAETLSRIPQMAPETAASLRNLTFPAPGAGQLLGWNGLGTGLALYDPAALVGAQVTSDADARQAWAADMAEPHVRANTVLPSVPAPPSLLLSPPYTEAYLRTSTGALVLVQQEAGVVGPLSEGDGTYYLALHTDTTTAVGGWTREVGTHWLWQLAVSQPADPLNMLVLAAVVVSGGAITRVINLGRYATREQALVYAHQFTRYYGMTGDALQAAIDALPPTGGIVKIDAGTYTLTDSLTIGDGDIGVASTRRGVILEGVSSGHYDETQCSVQLQWAGGANPVVRILGPLVGWGLKNLLIDGGGTASAGIYVQSAQYGDCANLTVMGQKGNGIWSISVPSAPPIPGWTGVTDCLKNHWQNIWIWHLAPADAATAALALDSSDISSNTDFNTFVNLTIFVAGVDGWAIYLGGADHNMFFNVHIGDDGTTRSDVHYAYDNGAFPGWPCGNNFYGLSLGNQGMTSSGTPLADNTCINYIFGMSGGDPVDFLPDLPGVVTFAARRVNQNLVLIPGSNTTSAEPIGNVEIYGTAAHPRNLIPTEDGWANLGTATKRFHDCYLLGGVRHTVRGETGDTTLQLADYYLQVGNNSVPVTVGLPPAADAAGREYVVKNVGTQTVTLEPDGAETINAAANFAIAGATQTVVRILSISSAWQVLAIYP